MDNVELYHHGTKGMKWGRRLYQYEDGSLTPLGRIHYRDPKARAQIKRQATVEAKKQAAKTAAEEAAELEAKRKQLLKSNDAAELYKNRDLLSTDEINERINRLNTEKRLADLVPHAKTKGEKFVEGIKKAGKTANDIYGFTQTPVMKALTKKLGIGKDDGDNKKFDLDKIYKNLDKLSDKEVKDASERISNSNKIVEEYNKRHGNNNANDKPGNKGGNNKGNNDNSNNKPGNKDSNTKPVNDDTGGNTSKKANLGKLGKSMKSKIEIDPDDAKGETSSEKKANIKKLSKSLNSKIKADDKVEFVDAELIDTGSRAVDKLAKSLASKVTVTESTRRSVIDAKPGDWKDVGSEISRETGDLLDVVRAGQDYWKKYLEDN